MTTAVIVRFFKTSCLVDDSRQAESWDGRRVREYAHRKGLQLTTSPAIEPSSCGGASRKGRASLWRIDTAAGATDARSAGAWKPKLRDDKASDIICEPGKAR